MTTTSTQQRQEGDRRLGGRLALAGVAAFLVAVPFMLLLLLVRAQWAPLTDVDQEVAASLNDVALGNGGLVSTLEVLAWVTQPWVFRLAILVLVIWLWRRGAPRLALWAAVTAVIGGVLGVVLKLIVERARPILDEPVAHASGYSFPSGHALNSMLCVGIIILVLLPVLGPPGRVVAYGVGAAVVLVTGFDRITLGVHYLSDVLAGWVVALACLAATAAAFEIWRREEGRRPSTPAEGVEPEAADEMRAEH